MALIKCKECKKEVAKSAKTCPHCGVAKPAKKDPSVIEGIIGIVMLVAIGYGITQCSSEDIEKNLQKAENFLAEKSNEVLPAQDYVHPWHKQSTSKKNQYCRKMINTMIDHKKFKEGIAKSIGRGKLSKELCISLDEFYSKDENIIVNQPTSDSAIILMTIMGWTK